MRNFYSNVIDKQIFFTKLVDSISEFYENDYYGYSMGLRNLHISVMSENYEPERFKKAVNLSKERTQFLTEVQAMVNEESSNYIYFL